MASFASVVRQQRQTQGRSVIGSLTGAVGRKTLEKIDPRNYLINREGILASLFPNLKGYQASGYRRPSQGSRSNMAVQSINLSMNSMIERLDTIISHENSISKNTLSLPKIEKDVGSIKRGIHTLLDVFGETLPKTGDAYKKLVSDREREIEQGFSIRRMPQHDETTPQRVSPTSGGDSSFFGNLVKNILIGGLGAGILTGIIQYLKGDSFKEGVDTFIGSLFGDDTKKIINDGFESILKSAKAVWDEHWPEIVTGLAVVGTLLNPLGALAGAVGALTSAIGLGGSVGLLGAITALTGAITALTGAFLLINPKSTQTDQFETQGKKNTSLDYNINRQKYDEQFRDTTLSDQLKKEEATKQELIKAGMNQALINPVQRRIDDLNAQQQKLNKSYIIGQQFKTNNYGNQYIQRMNELSNSGRPTPLDPTVPYTTPTPKPQGAIKAPLSSVAGMTASIDPSMQPAMGSLKGNNENISPSKAGSSNEGAQMLKKILDELNVTDQELRDRIFKVAKHESGLNINVPNSPAGAVGLMQIMPTTAKEMGYTKDQIISSPYIAAKAGVEYFLKNYKRFNDLDLATLSHHMGPNNKKAFDLYKRTGSVGNIGDVNEKTDVYLAKIKGSSVTEGSPGKSSPSMAGKTAPEQKQTIPTGFNDIMGQIANAPKGSFTSELLNKMWGKPGTRQQIENLQADISNNQGENPQPVVIMPRGVKSTPQPQQQIGGPIANVVDEDFVKKLVDSNLATFA